MAVKCDTFYLAPCQVKDALMRNRQYEGGIYGMPQAVEEIHQLKEAVYKEQGRVRELVQQINKLAGKVRVQGGAAWAHGHMGTWLHE